MIKKKNINRGSLSLKYVSAVFHQEHINIEHDDEFFELLKIGGSFLQTPEAIERIILWQREVNDKDNDVSGTAQEKLKKIGSILALKEKQIKKYSANRKRNDLILFRQTFLKKINAAGISELRSEGLKKKKLKTLFNPALIDRLLYIPKTNCKLANLICTQFFGYTLLTVERYIKGTTKKTPAE